MPWEAGVVRCPSSAQRPPPNPRNQPVPANLDDPAQANSPEAQLLELRQHALRVIDWLIEHGVAPGPIPYAVVYEYFSADSGDLQEALDTHLREGKAVDEYFLRELHELYLAADRFSRVRSMRDDIQNILRAVLETLEEVGSNNDEFRAALEDNIRQLADESTPEAIRHIAQGLLSAAMKADSGSGEMRRRLDQARQETEQLRMELEQQRRASLLDPLTSLYNRRAMEQFGDDMLDAGGAGCALLVLDIDFFKDINDTYGHAVGDVVLRQVADMLRKCIRGDDIAIRYGGEEFVVVLPKTNLPGAATVAEAIRHRIECLRLLRRSDNMSVRPFTISIGAAVQGPGDTWDTLFHRADKALYQAKREGRNKVVCESDLPAASPTPAQT